MKHGFVGWALLALAPLSASAGHQECNHRPVADSVRSCPDGSIPVYVAGDLQAPAGRVLPGPEVPGADAPPAVRAPARSATRPEFFYGVWRTRVSGAVWTSPSGYRGTEWLHVSTGVSVGDLIIRPDRTYVWNAWGGKRGRWIPGDVEYPVVLVDTAEGRQWRVGADPRHTGGRDIVVWDGYYSYDGRR